MKIVSATLFNWTMWELLFEHSIKTEIYPAVFALDYWLLCITLIHPLCIQSTSHAINNMLRIAGDSPQYTMF